MVDYPHYPYRSLWINGRNVELDEIIKSVAHPHNLFEQNLFDFIRSWAHAETFELHTSGSTGEPKPIRITKDQMIYSAKQTEQALSLTHGTTALVCLDPKFIAGKMMIVRSFVTGMKIIAVSPSSNPFDHIPVEIVIDFTAMVPYQLLNILDSKHAKRLDMVRSVLVGGAPLADEAKIRHVKTNIYATYGMTETISHIALRLMSTPNNGHFKAFPGVFLTLDNRGCLVISAPHLPEKVVTNDIVALKNPYEFQWLGRWDNVINSGGIKIIPEKIEAVVGGIFNNLELQNENFIAGIPDVKLGQKVILVVKGSVEDKKLEELRSELKKKLTVYEIPKDILTLSDFVYTESGKINRLKTVEII